MKLFNGYWELRELVKNIIPRRGMLDFLEKHKGLVKEKGRKIGYKEFSFDSEKFEIKQRLLNKDEITSFLEVSLRKNHCPMPLNADVYDALYCIAKGQLITTKTGFKKIEDIKVGDEIASYNESTKKVEFTQVLLSSSSEKTNLVEIETEKGLLVVTEDHQIFTKRGWVEAGQLNEDDLLLEIY
ncbi:MAG: hypothetical protein US68_C0021G0005 [Candidatus Shapirobacteria bacterium GW2011_GWE1_38_10]|uniref:Hint domain-containing protein n=1 Tax=Candidatus Shapirobacteria bacterium GW2011_GWE1_38_10 TaxID=1618488 RepID=A0A0G0KIE2_9BACT|nr:MAG: hypothetical protein US68_C0021G0005 [Candidatus Shapirobacteria bacterium GW2011_GWE1_38_10]